MTNTNFWTSFCENMKNGINDVRAIFDKDELTFDIDSLKKVQGIIDNKQCIDGLEKDLKDYIINTNDNATKTEISEKINKIFDHIHNSDALMGNIKNEFDKHKKDLDAEYQNAREVCMNLCNEAEKYTDDKLGVLNVIADTVQVVVTQNDFYSERAQNEVNGITKRIKRFYRKHIAIDMSLCVFVVFIICLLFKFGEGYVSPINWWCIGIITLCIVASFLGTLFLIIRIHSLLKSNHKAVMQLDMLQSRMKLNKMSKAEIDRELKSIEDIMQ